MKVLKLLSIALLLSLCLTSLGRFPALADESPTLRCDWYLWDPYQYLEAEGTPEEELTGLDVRLVRELFGRAGYRVDYSPVSWNQHQDDIRSGDRDIAAGAFQTAEREKYAYFSDPYREETNVIYVRKQESVKYPFEGSGELIAFLRDTPDFRIDIVEGYSTADSDLNSYLQEPEYAGQVVYSQNEYENLVNLVEGKIDASVSDRLVAATLAWRNNLQDQVEEHPGLLVSDTIHIMFSKETTTPELVEEFNQALGEARRDRSYYRIVRQYVFPVLLGITVERPWFLAIDIVGTIAFAISGLLLAHKEKYSKNIQFLALLSWPPCQPSAAACCATS